MNVTYEVNALYPCKTNMPNRVKFLHEKDFNPCEMCMENLYQKTSFTLNICYFASHTSPNELRDESIGLRTIRYLYM